MIIYFAFVLKRVRSKYCKNSFEMCYGRTHAQYTTTGTQIADVNNG